ncbi:hypothetical protein ACW2QC_04140 [Virgibacillus sp. FSP13]
MFNKSKLAKMNLVPTTEHEAFVVYPEQKRENRLYDINKTQTPKRRQSSGFSLTVRDQTKENVLQQRREEIVIERNRASIFMHKLQGLYVI